MPNFHRIERHSPTENLDAALRPAANFEAVRASELNRQLRELDDQWRKHAIHYDSHPKDHDGMKALGKTLAEQMEALRELREIHPQTPLLDTKLTAAEIGFTALQQKANALDNANWPWE